MKDSGPKIDTLADLMTAAYRIEADAVERYKMLADQMETFNNPELVEIFRDLAKAEGLHAEEIRQQAGDIDVVTRSSRMKGWGRGDSPEEVDLANAHYLMTPWHALQMALAGEKRALAFFTKVVETTKEPKIKEMAAEFVEEEAEHVNLVHRLLRKYPAPPSSWARDTDPAISQE